MSVAAESEGWGAILRSDVSESWAFGQAENSDDDVILLASETSASSSLILLFSEVFCY